MLKSPFIILILFFVIGCQKNFDDHIETFPMLSLDDIKREYTIADSLNTLKDRSKLNFETKVLGIDARNNQTIIRTPLNRGFGCLMISDYLTIKYLNCDSTCCISNGFWLVDYVGIVGSRSVVGCVPDTIKTEYDCGCTNQ